MASGTRQVMEMREADGCKTVGSDGDCGELAECLPHLVAFKLQQQQQNTVRTKQNPLVGLTRPSGRHFVTSGRRRRRGDKDSPEIDPQIRVGQGARRQEDWASVFWKLSVSEARAIIKSARRRQRESSQRCFHLVEIAQQENTGLSPGQID